ncbi:DUF1275 family protein [Salinivibrio sp. MA351]|uniref:YoaK family protein n=1 Tax=Salinivibrio TaxID=51366 RepID=UPI000988D948|nr:MULTISPECIES: YoaK family protein [unclassified Salinivibrio]OOE98488.1 DUF1275 family protein [Salinivibrio sp. IB643]OOF01132.1 DUF1275 family protein [Salinivibrio sp. MA351]OOF05678.1 DUF1275 family protein [Salinivibrio sp. MA440]
MITRLPRWVESGAFVLALIAGTINAIGLLGFEHQAVSHVSGTATQFGSGLFAGQWMHVVQLGGLLLAFFLGAAVSGCLLHGSTLKLGRHYDSALFVEAGLIVVAFYFLSRGLAIGQLAASAACGLQNAMATTYSGAIVRSTHLTGIVTDLGLMLGGKLRGNRVDKRKLMLFLLIASGFIVGGVVGAALFAHFHFTALLFPAGLCFVVALCYRATMTRQRLRSGNNSQ